MERRKLQTNLQERHMQISSSRNRNPRQMLWFLRQNLLLALYRPFLMSPPFLYCLHIDEVLFFCYQADSVSVQKSWHRRQMLWPLPDHSSLGSNNYDTAEDDDRVSCVPRAAGAHDQRRRETKEFTFLPSESASTVSPSRSLNTPHTWSMPCQLTEISSLILERRQIIRVSYLPGLQSSCDSSGWNSPGRWEEIVNHSPVDRGLTHQIRLIQARHQAEQNTSEDPRLLTNFNLHWTFFMYDVNS